MRSFSSCLTFLPPFNYLRSPTFSGSEAPTYPGIRDLAGIGLTSSTTSSVISSSSSSKKNPVLYICSLEMKALFSSSVIFSCWSFMNVNTWWLKNNGTWLLSSLKLTDFLVCLELFKALLSGWLITSILIGENKKNVFIFYQKSCWRERGRTLTYIPMVSSAISWRSSNSS